MTCSFETVGADAPPDLRWEPAQLPSAQPRMPCGGSAGRMVKAGPGAVRIRRTLFLSPYRLDAAYRAAHRSSTLPRFDWLPPGSTITTRTDSTPKSADPQPPGYASTMPV